MKKIMATMILVCIMGMTLTGCATRNYLRMTVSNVPYISRLYIRNAGTTHWGTNIVGQNIDMSRFSESVDIRVVDANDAVFSRYNVPFNVASFVVTNRTVAMSAAGATTLLLLGVGALIALTIIPY